MSDTVISVENLGKRYLLGRSHQGKRYQTMREGMTETFRSSFRRLRAAPPAQSVEDEEFWALRDVSFEVKRGEVVGIIGRNGAGKSTLLKVLSRITEPTTGRITLNGRVASLLEVGTGFHPELTGRENIHLNGAILGMHRREIRAKFDEIVAFAEVERFLDTPVKRYSSGMYVRLAFAVAAHLEPEILIVDEVLAVGDSEFQKKCLGKMDQVARGGKTVLFVSHNMSAIADLTSRCILLKQSRLEFQGPTREAVSQYLHTADGQAQLSYRAERHGSRPQVIRMDVVTSMPQNVQGNGEPFEIVVGIFTPRPLRAASLTLQIIDEQQTPIVQLWTYGASLPMLREAGIATIRCRVPKLRLFIGNYTIKTYLSESGGEHFGSLEGLCPFQVIMQSERADYPWREPDCRYLEEFSWQLDRAEAAPTAN